MKCSANYNLVTEASHVAKTWNYEKNKELHPEFFSSGSGKKVWWKCANDHEWEETIQKRAIRHFGCPYCSGKRASKENSFETKYPHLLSFWDQEKNTILPSQVTAGSGISIYFKCPNCNYSFERTVINMTKSQKCPNCKKAKRMLKLNIQYPELIKEWNYSKNEHPPEYYSAHSNQKVWWKCANGHEWGTQIYSRAAKHTGCPYCYKNNRKRKTI